jgi:Rrf2 family protein
MLSQRARYALHAMLHLGRKGGGPVTAAAIAIAEGIPRKFLEQILLTLTERGLLTSRRGPNGGYQLAREATRISFAEIIRAIDGPLALAPCVSLTAPGVCADCTSAETCEIRPVLLAVRQATAGLLEATTLDSALGGAQHTVI